MKIDVVAFGKIKSPGLRQSADYYKKLSSKYSDIQEIECKPAPVFDKSNSSFTNAQNIEADRIEKYLEKFPRSKIIAMDEDAPSRKTKDWSVIAEELESLGTSPLVFLVGSSVGIHSKILDKAAHRISLGSQTISHELARVVLFEQIYRMLTVINNHPYHHEGKTL